jgi:hypothetical protein
MPMKAYMFRPGYVQPLDGAVSRTPAYRVLYRVGAVLYPLLSRIAPGHITTTEAVGRAMIAVGRGDWERPAVLRNADINRLSAA